MSSTEEDLKKLRIQIDSLDENIIDLIQKRAEFASEIGRIKRNSSDPIYRPDRERDVYEKVSGKSKGPLPASVIRAIYREIMSGTIALEHPLEIGYLGPEGSFSHEALRSKFGTTLTSVGMPTIPDVFRSTASGKIDYGVVPVENSTEGQVSSTLDMLLDSDVTIYSELYQRIRFSLLGFETDLTKIKKIYGIRIGNEQCRNWISANLSHAEIIETSSTAMAAKIVSEKKDGAAIASNIAAEIYGLQVIHDGIEDFSGNTTRFLVIGKTECPKTEKDKTSLVFSVPNRTGALYTILQKFHERSINMSKIESRPLKRNLWEYNFFIDFLGHKDDPKIKELLKETEKECSSFKILGSYPLAEQNL
ncbi:bifunctional chorismate mutase/prephenate dehydratase [Leptospira kobayashii]|uniref:Bifunctional chorismate mutase/prephenate dehydratase n=1 Tax=Leptospira kobayashii TaxID=1917830 RepID=A0ABM7UKU5_9LEPT|nr:prephenate dehydratase [Leptospira kobayashii]BDA79542.1 bifunctional chorismate mutase/prephenate dehydratase [Leptospira kobayashii]